MRPSILGTLMPGLSTACVVSDGPQPATKDSVRVAGIVLKWIRGDKDD